MISGRAYHDAAPNAPPARLGNVNRAVASHWLAFASQARPSRSAPPIDLNPVRAGLVRDPKDYRWSGYGEAVAGQARARAGLTRLVGM